MNGSSIDREGAGALQAGSPEHASRCEALWWAGKGLTGEMLRLLVREIEEAREGRASPRAEAAS
jgi:hypothetical protein